MTKRDAIIDNQDRRVGDFLRDRITGETLLSVVSAYFTIYAYHDLRAELESIRGMRFLYGEPRGVGAVDPGGDADKAFRLTADGGIELKQALGQKPLARACEAWIRSKVEIRTIEKSNFLHGKLYHLAQRNGDNAAVLGSSNFTRGGLGLGVNPNIELNLEVRREADREPLLRWFNALWNDQNLTRDAREDVLTALAKLGKDYAPDFVYYKTLFHVLEERLADRAEREGLIQNVHLYDTKVWKALFSFQRDGAVSAINRLMRHNGCIIADSVGLGKTWTALAVIKFFEILNERVLVLCPKKLEQNWVRYTSWAGQANNPLAEDRLGYTVLAHTDLSRCGGMAGVVDLSNFNWSAFDLIVIDESHNFRNEGRDKKDDEGNLIARSRYNRLLEEVLKEGAHTKVLMLSATPVNTSLRDLRNQIFLMTEKRKDAFKDSIGIVDIGNVFRLAQKEFQKWERECTRNGRRDKATLLERLGADFLAILDAVSIARSREHVRRVYPEVEQEIGGFPERAAPRNLHPPTDSEGRLSYDSLYERISRFRLAVYMPSQYLKDKSKLEEEKAKLNFDQRDREHWLVGMMRVNLLKRLESSVHSFTLTMERILSKMDELNQRIERWLEDPTKHQVTLLADEDEEDEEFTFGKGRRYPLGDLNLKAWQKDLQSDRQMFYEIFRQAKQVGVERDAKLAELRGVLKRKVREAPANKDGERNRKVLIFTTFSDTARYLYENLQGWARSALDVHIAMVTGSGGNHSTVGSKKFAEILGRFAPKAQEAGSGTEQIDILIATDCLSEGQNLQDCDLVVNYDIHWNPVRLMQRFGRIDRIGSRNHRVAMANFWPTQDLDRYLDLKNRVEARMALVDAAATGQDDLLAADSVEALEQAAQYELGFRERQLRRIREESLDIEDVDDGVSMSDFTLDDFLAELMQYLESRRAELEAAPFGISAVVPPEPTTAAGDAKGISPGVIFCLKLRTAAAERTPNRLHPYFLAYVREDGTVRYSFQQAKQILSMFRALAAGRGDALTDLVNAFDRDTGHGQEMTRYEAMLAKALRQISGKFRNAQLRELTKSRGAKVTKKSESPHGADAFELVTWLAITDVT
ncbi:helicase-related protein [Candidatus Palauibacter sp.]|uniref:helicase-related protein n=1 Tax=Candidatus Palauibacter sp. TaxID=3101350 RepID=UPI003B5CC175